MATVKPKKPADKATSSKQSAAAKLKTLLNALRPSETDQAYRRSALKDSGDIFSKILFVLLIGVFLVLIWFVWQSIEVYVSMGVDIGLNWVTANLPAWGAKVISIPILGNIIQWLLNGGAVTISVIGCIALYGVLQIFEVAPILLEDSPQTLKRIIRSTQSMARVVIHREDSQVVAYLKDRHNAIPEDWVNNIYTAKWIAYSLDLMVCLVRCPPFFGDWAEFWLFWQSMDISDIDFTATWKIIVTLFAVEAVVKVLLWLKRGRRMLKSNP